MTRGKKPLQVRGIGADRTVRRLTPDQLAGLACVVCGDSSRAMIPLGLQTKTSSEVFRCNRAECAVPVAEVQRWINVSKSSV